MVDAGSIAGTAAAEPAPRQLHTSLRQFRSWGSNILKWNRVLADIYFNGITECHGIALVVAHESFRGAQALRLDLGVRQNQAGKLIIPSFIASDLLFKFTPGNNA